MSSFRLAIPFILLSFVALLLWCRAPLHRPFEGDEIFSLRRFSSLPYEQNVDVVSQWKPFELSRCLHGIAKCFLNGYDNSNHLLITLPASLSAFLFGYSEAAFRVPALIAGMITCLGIFWLCRSESGSSLFALALAALILSSPYLYHYGQTARGYAANLAMVVVQIVIVQTASRQTRVRTYAAMAAVSVFMCMNILTSAIMWLVPLFAVLILWGKDPATDRSSRREERLYWLGAAVCAGVPCAMFGICHLHDIVTAQGKWGIQWHSRSDMAAMARGLWEYFIPGFWIPSYCLAIAGIFAALHRGKWLARVMPLSLIVSFSYVLIGHKVPYFRTFGQFLIYIPLCAAWLWAEVVNRPHPVDSFPRMIAGGLLGCLVAVTSVFGFYQDIRTPPPPDYTDMGILISRRIAAEGRNTKQALVLSPFDIGEQIRYYLPGDQRYVDPDAQRDHSFSVYLPCAMNGKDASFLTETLTKNNRDSGYWIPPAAWASGNLPSLPGFQTLCGKMQRIAGFPAPGVVECVVSWSGIDPYFSLRSYIAAQAPHFCGDALLYFNLEDYLPEQTVLFFIQTPAQSAAVGRLLADLNARTQGHVWTMIQSVDPGQR